MPVERIRGQFEQTSLFSFHAVSEENVLKAIGKASRKNSSGPDGISMAIIKDAAEVLATPLTRIINVSFAQGYFPAKWKTAHITPVLKKGDATNVADYRPVALLNSFSKIAESLAQEQMSRHLEEENILPECQHGYPKHRSTVSALLDVCSAWEAASQKGLTTGIVIFDLSAAFNCLNAQIMDEKLKTRRDNALPK